MKYLSIVALAGLAALVSTNPAIAQSGGTKYQEESAELRRPIFLEGNLSGQWELRFEKDARRTGVGPYLLDVQNIPTLTRQAVRMPYHQVYSAGAVRDHKPYASLRIVRKIPQHRCLSTQCPPPRYELHLGRLLQTGLYGSKSRLVLVTERYDIDRVTHDTIFFTSEKYIREPVKGSLQRIETETYPPIVPMHWWR